MKHKADYNLKKVVADVADKEHFNPNVKRVIIAKSKTFGHLWRRRNKIPTANCRVLVASDAVEVKLQMQGWVDGGQLIILSDYPLEASDAIGARANLEPPLEILYRE